ncbi:unnamed protein product [Didymodactylos carnosus]|uniref:Uncharacterized protein n=1 Tax=Didymodactylos carnosus TaxID=1234261 RepID=A0A814A554_9BILA|nr:unnamed protein product [Didymodactylos carnosus]CAF3690404.1 unnamed protein product [Didymodactylos carnosus]
MDYQIFSLIVVLFNVFIIHIQITIGNNYRLGIVNYNTVWFHYCNNQTKEQIFIPVPNSEKLIEHKCQLKHNNYELIYITPAEIDFTFVCRTTKPLPWIIIDLYQYVTINDYKKIHVDIILNKQINITKRFIEHVNYTNRFVDITAFVIHFEYIEMIKYLPLDITVILTTEDNLTKCLFYLYEKEIWKSIMDNCNMKQSKTLHVLNATCHFYVEQSISDDSNSGQSHNTNLDLSPSEHYHRELQHYAHIHQIPNAINSEQRRIEFNKNTINYESITEKPSKLSDNHNQIYPRLETTESILVNNIDNSTTNNRSLTNVLLSAVNNNDIRREETLNIATINVTIPYLSQSRSSSQQDFRYQNFEKITATLPLSSTTVTTDARIIPYNYNRKNLSYHEEEQHHPYIWPPRTNLSTVQWQPYLIR